MSSIDTRSSRSRRPVETKPFYMTSEFMVMTAMTVALFVASLAVDDVDSRLAWILGVSLVGIYILSRGIAKAGSSSRSYDPREDARLDDGYREAPLTRDSTSRSGETSRTGL